MDRSDDSRSRGLYGWKGPDYGRALGNIETTLGGADYLGGLAGQGGGDESGLGGLGTKGILVPEESLSYLLHRRP